MQSGGQTNLSQLSADWLMTLPILLLFVQMSRCLLQPPKLIRTMQSVTLILSLPASCLPRQRKRSFLVFVRVCWKHVWYRCFSLCVKIYCWRQSKICQVVGPIKGRSPLFTPRSSWFLTKGEKGGGAMSWLKTKKQWWMKQEGYCSSQYLDLLRIWNFQIYFQVNVFYFMLFYFI